MHTIIYDLSNSNGVVIAGDLEWLIAVELRRHRTTYEMVYEILKFEDIGFIETSWTPRQSPVI